MKKIILAAIAVSAMLPQVSFAAVPGAAVNNPNANANAC